MRIKALNEREPGPPPLSAIRARGGKYGLSLVEEGDSGRMIRGVGTYIGLVIAMGRLGKEVSTRKDSRVPMLSLSDLKQNKYARPGDYDGDPMGMFSAIRLLVGD